MRTLRAWFVRLGGALRGIGHDIEIEHGLASSS